MITLQYTIEHKDFIAFYTHVYWERGKKKRLINFLKQAVIVVVFLLVIRFGTGLGSFNNFSIPIYILVFITTLLPLFTSKATIRNDAEKITENVENEPIFTEYLFKADENSFVLKTDFSEKRYIWFKLIKKTETEDYFFLFENAITAIIIPKRAFSNDEEIKAFNKLLSRSLSLEAEFKPPTN